MLRCTFRRLSLRPTLLLRVAVTKQLGRDHTGNPSASTAEFATNLTDFGIQNGVKGNAMTVMPSPVPGPSNLDTQMVPSNQQSLVTLVADLRKRVEAEKGDATGVFVPSLLSSNAVSIITALENFDLYAHPEQGITCLMEIVSMYSIISSRHEKVLTLCAEHLLDFELPAEARGLPPAEEFQLNGNMTSQSSDPMVLKHLCLREMTVTATTRILSVLGQKGLIHNYHLMAQGLSRLIEYTRWMSPPAWGDVMVFLAEFNRLHFSSWDGRVAVGTKAELPKRRKRLPPRQQYDLGDGDPVERELPLVDDGANLEDGGSVHPRQGFPNLVAILMDELESRLLKADANYTALARLYHSNLLTSSSQSDSNLGTSSTDLIDAETDSSAVALMDADAALPLTPKTLISLVEGFGVMGIADPRVLTFLTRMTRTLVARRELEAEGISRLLLSAVQLDFRVVDPLQHRLNLSRLGLGQKNALGFPRPLLAEIGQSITQDQVRYLGAAKPLTILKLRKLFELVPYLADDCPQLWDNVRTYVLKVNRVKDQQRQERQNPSFQSERVTNPNFSHHSVGESRMLSRPFFRLSPALRHGDLPEQPARYIPRPLHYTGPGTVWGNLPRRYRLKKQLDEIGGNRGSPLREVTIGKRIVRGHFL